MWRTLAARAAPAVRALAPDLALDVAPDLASGRSLSAAASRRSLHAPAWRRAAAPASRRHLSVAGLEDVVVTKAAADRIGRLEADGGPARLRLAIDGGGCSGFEYKFSVETADGPLDEDDHVFERDGRAVVVDDASLEFVRGATIDFEQEMIRSAFAVVNNPNSDSACGCGSSFALKNFEDNPAVD